jgi:signal peptidase I
MNWRKNKSVAAVGLIIILLIVALILFFINRMLQPVFNNLENQNAESLTTSNPASCVVTKEEKIVSGQSMAPLIKDGQTIKILFDYYKCHGVERNDVVAYKFSGDANPIIKMIKGMPGDTFHLLRASGSCWNILINNEFLKNSQNISYCFPDDRRLALYEKDYNGLIPKNAYLIFGDQPGGSLDSSVFGLIDQGDILGKVEY